MAFCHAYIKNRPRAYPMFSAHINLSEDARTSAYVMGRQEDCYIVKRGHWPKTDLPHGCSCSQRWAIKVQFKSSAPNGQSPQFCVYSPPLRHRPPACRAGASTAWGRHFVRSLLCKSGRGLKPPEEKDAFLHHLGQKKEQTLGFLSNSTRELTRERR